MISGVFSIDCSNRSYCVDGVCEEMNGYAAIRERSNRCLPLLGLVCPRGFACNMANNWCEKVHLTSAIKKMPFYLLS
uniref:EB domain-containing protein n=1 Tax=Ascaris lumbricoides TaxID=6252 RepID=A0A0M3HY04_ASCLU